MLNERTIGIIGVGVMGRAIISGLLHSGTTTRDKIWASARTVQTCRRVENELGVKSYREHTELLADTDVLVVCLKPGKVVDVLKTLKLSPHTLVISIAAGVTLDEIHGALAVGGNSQNPVIRAMPNTPMVVQQGMTVLTPGTHAEDVHMALATELFEAVGKTLELEEHHFDAVTALCGSGPAYLFLIMEALADGGVRSGLQRDVALQIVAQTVLGSASMVQQSGRHPAALKDDVSTPAGCTIGALLVLEDGKIRSVLARAVEEAAAIAAGLGPKKSAP